MEVVNYFLALDVRHAAQVAEYCSDRTNSQRQIYVVCEDSVNLVQIFRHDRLNRFARRLVVHTLRYPRSAWQPGRPPSKAFAASSADPLCRLRKLRGGGVSVQPRLF